MPSVQQTRRRKTEPRDKRVLCEDWYILQWKYFDVVLHKPTKYLLFLLPSFHSGKAWQRAVNDISRSRTRFRGSWVIQQRRLSGGDWRFWSLLWLWRQSLTVKTWEGIESWAAASLVLGFDFAFPYSHSNGIWSEEYPISSQFVKSPVILSGFVQVVSLYGRARLCCGGDGRDWAGTPGL